MSNYYIATQAIVKDVKKNKNVRQNIRMNKQSVCVRNMRDKFAFFGMSDVLFGCVEMP